MTSQGKPHPAGEARPAGAGAAPLPSTPRLLYAPHPAPASINLLPPSPAELPTTCTRQDASSAPPRRGPGGFTLCSRGGRGNLRPRGRGVAGITCGPGPPRSSGRGSARSPCPPAASPAAVPGVSTGRHSASRARGRAPSPGGVSVRGRRARPGNPSRRLPTPRPGPPAPAPYPTRSPASGGSRIRVSAPGERAAAGSGAAAGPQVAAAAGGGGVGPRVSAKSAATPGPGGREAGR